MKVTVDIDTADIVEQAMVQDLQFLVNDIRRLRKISDLREHQKIDLLDNIRFAKSIVGVMEYYLPADQHKKIKEKYSVDLDLDIQ